MWYTGSVSRTGVQTARLIHTSDLDKETRSNAHAMLVEAFEGAFTDHDVLMTRQALVAYSVGLLGLILVKVLAPGFYSRQNVKTPVKIAVFTLFATQIMNIVFVFGLDLKHAGLALAIGLGACINAGLLYFYLRKSGAYQPQPGWFKFLVKLLSAVTAMALAVYFAAGAESTWFDYSLVAKLTHLTALIALGAAGYFAALWLMGIHIKDFMHRTVA